MKGKPGFTLIEMLCTLVIAGIVLVAVSNIVGHTILWSQWGNEERIIGNQMEQALDYMEADIRQAKGIDVSFWEKQVALETMSSSSELHLRTVDPQYVDEEGVLIYIVKAGSREIAEDTPLERPVPNYALYRSLRDSQHSGYHQPIAMHLNSHLDTERGLRVYYYNKQGKPCSLAEEIFSVKVVLSGWTRAHDLVTRSRTIPLHIKR